MLFSLKNAYIQKSMGSFALARFSGVFRAYKMGTLARNGMIFMFLETDNVPLLSH